MSYRRLLRPLLFSLDPERAHDAAVRVLAASQGASGLLEFLYRAPYKPRRVAGLSFRNPVGLAAGFDKDCRLAEVLPSFGFGFIELGTLTWQAQPGNPKPRLFRLPGQKALLNRLGFNNPGAAAAARRLEKLKARPIPIGLNVGKSAAVPIDDAAEDYFKSLEALKDLGDYYVLNISSPNTADLRKLHERPRLEALLTGAKKRLGAKPLFVKVSPDLDDAGLDGLAALCVSLRVGVVASNTTVSREGLEARWKDQAGGVSGAPLKAAALRTLKRLKERTEGKVPLIGVGGIFTAEDAKERLAAGADLIQIYTGWIYEGPGLVRRLVEGL